MKPRTRPKSTAHAKKARATKKGRNQRSETCRKMADKTREGNNHFPEEAMRFVGIDLHKRSLTVCVIDKKSGETFDRRFSCSEEAKIRAFFEDGGAFQAVVEASATYQWLWELLEPLAQRLVLAHPKKIRIIAESMKKTDRRDAYFLAWLLSQDAVPEAHCPTPRQREYQHLVKHRQFLVHARTRLKTQIRSILARRNFDIKGLFSSKGREYLAQLPLTPTERFRIREDFRLLESLEGQVGAVENELRNFRKEAARQEKKNHQIITSVPGFGNLTADVLLSTLGDIERFSSEGKVASYSGLCPGYRVSDTKRRELPITKEGPRILRSMLVQAAWSAIRYSDYWKETFERIARRRGRKKAVVAVARKLLVVVYSLLKSGNTYCEKLVIPQILLKRLKPKAPVMKTS